MIEEGAELHDRTNEGCSPLLLACHNGHIFLALDLIRCGANLDDEDNFGVTALDSYGDGTDKSNLLIEEEIVLLKKAYAASGESVNCGSKSQDSLSRPLFFSKHANCSSTTTTQ